MGRIQNPRSGKNFQIPDPDPQHWFIKKGRRVENFDKLIN
jgi:hypothetical protein